VTLWSWWNPWSELPLSVSGRSWKQVLVSRRFTTLIGKSTRLGKRPQLTSLPKSETSCAYPTRTILIHTLLCAASHSLHAWCKTAPERRGKELRATQPLIRKQATVSRPRRVVGCGRGRSRASLSWHRCRRSASLEEDLGELLWQVAY
jgi:hypothetical protein